MGAIISSHNNQFVGVSQVPFNVQVMGGNHFSSKQPPLGTTQVPSMGDTNIPHIMAPYGCSGPSVFPFLGGNYSLSGPYGIANVPFPRGVNPPQ